MKIYIAVHKYITSQLNDYTNEWDFFEESTILGVYEKKESAEVIKNKKLERAYENERVDIEEWEIEK